MCASAAQISDFMSHASVSDTSSHADRMALENEQEEIIASLMPLRVYNTALPGQSLLDAECHHVYAAAPVCAVSFVPHKLSLNLANPMIIARLPVSI